MRIYSISRGGTLLLVLLVAALVESPMLLLNVQQVLSNPNAATRDRHHS